MSRVRDAVAAVGRQRREVLLSALPIPGPDEPAARALLAERADEPLGDEVCTRLLAQAGGNPLALVELPTALTEAQRSGTAPMPPRLPLTADVERVFLDRCRRLPDHVQTLLLVASPDDSGQLARSGTPPRCCASARRPCRTCTPSCFTKAGVTSRGELAQATSS